MIALSCRSRSIDSIHGSQGNTPDGRWLGICSNWARSRTAFTGYCRGSLRADLAADLGHCSDDGLRRTLRFTLLRATAPLQIGLSSSTESWAVGARLPSSART